jgi:hypothetical protein
MKTIIHVNRHLIARNKKCNIKDRLPPLTVKDYKQNRKGNTVEILDKSGKVAATVVYTPDNPLNCGAVAYIVTNNKVNVR